MTGCVCCFNVRLYLYLCYIFSAPLVKKLFPRMLGGPFFTSVPCGRVGMSKVRINNSAGQCSIIEYNIV